MIHVASHVDEPVIYFRTRSLRSPAVPKMVRSCHSKGERVSLLLQRDATHKIDKQRGGEAGGRGGKGRRE